MRVMTSSRGILEPLSFEQVSSSTLPAAEVGAVSLKDMSSLITTKENRVKNTRVKKGFVHQKGNYIGGAVDFETGILTPLSLPEPTTAQVPANKEQSTKERVNANKFILDSANSNHAKVQVMTMEMTRSIEDHQINVVRQVVMGNFTPVPLKVINQKSVLLSVVAYNSLSADQIQQLSDNIDKAKAQAAHMSDIGGIDVDMIMPSHSTGFG